MSAEDLGEKQRKQCCVELARELTTHFDRWCLSLNIKTLDELREAIIIEQLKNTMPDRVATHLSESKTKTVAEAAALANEFSLTHRHHHSGDFRMHNDFGRGDNSRCHLHQEGLSVLVVRCR